ncbi:hypothetical protein [Streptomyces sp. NPDC057199]|uniref:hypothetical protein n=1 Tax=Streptomyces sp. NPDC057199 TaxID=3346047 RepID=UPI00363D20C8
MTSRSDPTAARLRVRPWAGATADRHRTSVGASGLPPAAGKKDDPRWPGFARRHGFDLDCPVQWEVEALEPADFKRLVMEAVEMYLDRAALAQVMTEEEDQRRRLSHVLGWQQEN